MKNIPEKIYLQVDADGETPDSFPKEGQVTWCSDRINQNDIEYTLVQFNKPPVYGQWIDVKSLEPESPDMVNIILEDGFRSVGRKYSNGWGVFFMDGEDLIKPDSGKRQVTHWMPLPPSPGSVDVEEKKECQHEALTDTGVGYHHCPTCNASFKVDGLGDSSGSEKQEHFVLKDDGKLYWIEKMPEFPAALNQFDPHDMSHYQNIILKSAIDNAVEVSNQEELCNTLLNKYEPEILVEAGKLYSLQCSVVRTVKWKQGKSYMPYEVPVAVVAFSKDLSREGEKELVSGIAMQKAIEFVRTYPTGNTFDYRMGFEAGHEKEIKDIAASGRNYTNWDLVLQLACDGSLTKDKLDSIVTDAIGIATNKSVKEVSREGEKDRDQMIIDSIRARDNRIKVLEEALKELVKDTDSLTIRDKFRSLEKAKQALNPKD